MESVLDCLPQNSRVAILRLRSLGDCVLTTPAADLLKRARPDLRLAIVVEDRFRAVFEGNPDFERILSPRLSELLRWHPRLCLNLHGGTRSAWLTALSGASQRAGFGHYRHGFVYNVHIPRAQEILWEERKVHTAEHLASAMFYLGVPVGPIPRAKLCARESPAPPLPTAVIHPLAATPAKTWPAANFLAIAERLRQSGMRPVFIGGPADDLSKFSAFPAMHGAPLDEIKTLLSNAALFIGNDSGPAHMAAAFGVPVVAIFGASDPVIWAPWRTASAILTAPGGIDGVQVDQVLQAAARLQVHA